MGLDEIEKTAENNLDSDDPRCKTCYSLLVVRYEKNGSVEYAVMRCVNPDCKKYNEVVMKVKA